MPKRTNQPKKIPGLRKKGFLHRMAKHVNVIKARRRKGRHVLSASKQ